MVTIKDVAKEANVSHATVSRVINNSPNVSKNTRVKVLNIIERLNFSPNQLAQGMRLNRSQTIGLFVATLTNPFYAETAKTIVDTANKLGYTIILCVTNNSVEKQNEYIAILQSKKADGYLFASALLRDKTINSFLKTEKPCVFYNRKTNVNESINYVVHDNVEGMYLATKHLLDLGHTNIAFIRGNQRFSTALDRYNGYKNALVDYDVPYDDKVVVDGEYDVDTTVKETRKLLSLPKTPTAILASNDLMALSAIEVIVSSGLRVPEDIAVVGYDNVDIAGHSLIQLTTVSQNESNMADIAIRSLVQIIENKKIEEPPIQITLIPKLVIRKTSGYKLNNT